MIDINKYTVIDIETTGLKWEEGAEITEIAGANVQDGETLRTFSSIIKIDGKINDFIKNLTGITQEMVDNSNYLDEVFHTFMDCLDIDNETNLVIHNAKFDFNFIKYWIRHTCRYNIDESYIKRFENVNIFCSLELAKSLLPGESHKMEDLKKKFGIKSKSHRALNDVLITKKVYEKLIKMN